MRFIPGLLLVALALSGCKPRPAPQPAPAPAPLSSARVAVLYVEDYAAEAVAGPALYADQVEKLASLLRARGLAVETLLVSADDETPAIPAPIDLAILVDTPRLREGERRMLASFVEAGGVLLVIGPPAAEDLLGVAAVAEEPVARSGESKLLDAQATWVGDREWGPLARQRWPIQLAGAAAIVEENGAPVLTVRSVDAGRAYYWAVLPTGRNFNGWDASPGGVAMIEALARSIGSRNRPAAPAPQKITASINPIVSGDAGWPARLVARVQGGETNAAVAGSYVVRNEQGEVARSGRLEERPARWRSRFLTADLNALPKGVYRIELTLPPSEPVALSIRSDAAAFKNEMERMVSDWLDEVALPPIDAVSDSDLPRLAEDRALLMWALSRALQMPSAPDRYRQDLERLAFWMRAAGPKLFGQSPAPRDALATYAAGLARAVQPLRDNVSHHLAQEIQVLAEQAYGLLSAQPADDTASIGGKLWAAIELHRVTYIQEFRAAADAAARQLFGRQLERGRSADGDVYGVLFQDAGRVRIESAPERAGYEAGLWLGLIQLEDLAEAGTFKVDVGTVLDRYAAGFLLATETLNPYGICAVGLEPASPPRPRPDGRGMAAPERFRPVFFSRTMPPAGREDEAIRLAQAVVAVERARVSGEEALRRLAHRQLNWMAGQNPAARSLWAGGRILGGWIGRGPENVPVWREANASSHEGFPEMPWLLVLLALLNAPPPS